MRMETIELIAAIKAQNWVEVASIALKLNALQTEQELNLMEVYYNAFQAKNEEVEAGVGNVQQQVQGVNRQSQAPSRQVQTPNRQVQGSKRQVQPQTNNQARPSSQTHGKIIALQGFESRKSSNAS